MVLQTTVYDVNFTPYDVGGENADAQNHLAFLHGLIGTLLDHDFGLCACSFDGITGFHVVLYDKEEADTLYELMGATATIVQKVREDRDKKPDARNSTALKELKKALEQLNTVDEEPF